MSPGPEPREPCLDPDFSSIQLCTLGQLTCLLCASRSPCVKLGSSRMAVRPLARGKGWVTTVHTHVPLPLPTRTGTCLAPFAAWSSLGDKDTSHSGLAPALTTSSQLNYTR